MTDDLVQRLRRTYRKEFAVTGSTVGDISNRLRPFPILATEVLFNPDGTAAADRIEQLEREKAVVSDLWEQQKQIALDYLADCNKAAEHIEAQAAEIERLKNKLSVDTEPSPYCPICGSCGDEGCCGSKRCMYPAAEWQAGYEAGIEAAANALEADAKKCDCFAYEENECDCGAWYECKSITSARAVEIVRALQEQSK